MKCAYHDEGVGGGSIADVLVDHAFDGLDERCRQAPRHLAEQLRHLSNNGYLIIDADNEQLSSIAKR